jgi:transmembrane protein EpsG
MFVNLIVILLILGIGFHYGRKHDANSNKNRLRFIKIVSFVLILQSGLRNEAVGDDTFTYKEYFEEKKNESWDEVLVIVSDYYKFNIGKDPGYVIIEKLVSSLTENYTLYLLLIALFFFSALGNFIYYNSSRLKDIVISYLIYSVLFYSFFSITGHRQTIATAITLFSFNFIKQKKLLPFILLILLGSTIHKSCLVFIPFYFACRINKPKLIFIGALLLFPIFFVFKDILVLFVQNIGGYNEYEQYEGAGTYTFTAMFVFLSIIAVINQKYITQQSNINIYNYVAFAFAIVFLPLTWINPSMMRIVQYFSIFMLIFVPEILRSFEHISAGFYKRVRTVAIITLFLLFLKSSWNAPPYGFFWENMRLKDQYYSDSQ